MLPVLIKMFDMQPVFLKTLTGIELAKFYELKVKRFRVILQKNNHRQGATVSSLTP